MKITSFVERNLVSADLKSHTRDDVFSEILDHITRYKKLKDTKLIYQNLLAREAKGSTDIGNGVALPHARIEGLKEPIVFVGVAKRGINFHAIDGNPVHVVILFLTPLEDTATHLKILSSITALLEKRYIVERMMRTESDEELYDILRIEEVDRTGYLSLSKEEIYRELDTGDTGLSDVEARKRLTRYGKNELKKIRKTPLYRRFLYNFTNTLALLMWVGAFLAFIARIPEIGWAIIAVIIINAIFSFWQEFKAEKALDALKHLIPSYVRVMRNGKETRILSSDVVPGDIVIVEEGDSVPADGRLIEAAGLRVDNSVFSGESRPGYKSAESFPGPGNLNWTEIPNLIFAGTSVVSGSGKAVIIATGMSTEIGLIAYLTMSVKEELSPLQKEISRLTKVIAIIAVAMGVIFLLIGTSVGGLSLTAAAIFAIGIILGNVPEGLMPTVTLSLAMAVQRMAKRNALIKKLSSVETLGSCNVICTDKTGTLTMNQISVRRIWINDTLIEVTGSSYEPTGAFLLNGRTLSTEELKKHQLDFMIKAGILCSTAKLIAPTADQKYWTVMGDPTEGALIVLGEKAGIDIETLRSTYRYIKKFPFEAIRKRMSSINIMPNGSLKAFVKGAPKELAELSVGIEKDGRILPMTPEKRQEIAQQIDQFAREGLRVLAVAHRDVSQAEAETATVENTEKDLIFLGLTGMYDPPRPGIKESLDTCRHAGIRVVMITGDYGLTAIAISRQVGIISSENVEVITGAQMNEMSDTALKEKLHGEVIFARVNPEHKLRVVSAFRELGNIVAVTGDGVNDAPALKRADIGVAMGIRGTDVAKESAEMILTNDDFSSIVSAIEEGRAVFENIRKFITYIFAHLVPEAVPFILYIIFKLPVPITALQILAIDLGTETLPALALGIEKPEKGIMDQPPRPREKGLINSTVLFRGYVYLGILNTIAVLTAYFMVLYAGGWRPGVQLEPNDTTFINPLHLKAMTMVFVGIVVMQIANLFETRSATQSVFKIGVLGNPLILWGIAFELAFTAMLVYTPFFQRVFDTISISWQDWGILFVFMLFIFLAEELRKYVVRKGNNAARHR
jgi:calcium-translocating P-type ATPase